MIRIAARLRREGRGSSRLVAAAGSVAAFMLLAGRVGSQASPLAETPATIEPAPAKLTRLRPTRVAQRTSGAASATASTRSGASAGAVPAAPRGAVPGGAAAKASGASSQSPKASPPPGGATTSELPTAPPPASVSSYTPPPARKLAPAAPPPSPEQLKALQQMQEEAGEYEKAAKDYRDTITRIVQYHYDQKRRRMLASLDSEIDVEKKSLKEAREEAIKRLEEFVERYSGSNAHPENTPDAMFRLAALYEERARSEATDDVTEGLKPAILLYKRLIREFPNYRELAGIYYYLGHALNDSSRLEEAQQVWRSLVCHNKYPYPVPANPKNPDQDTIVRLPQDHDEDYWRGWENAHPIPVGIGAAKPRGTRVRAASAEDEASYVNPYPDSCLPIPQQTEPGTDPRYIAEIWWQIGNWHFDQIDPRGGPYNFCRAASAYGQGMKFKRPPLYGVAMYKLAWTYFKQQRYQSAVHEFVNLLSYTDEQEKATGDPGADFRAEAYTYIAGSLTYLDFVGPGENEPFIARTDVLDSESNPGIAESKMHIAVERVQDPKLIPQDKKWTPEIYKAVILEFRQVNQYRNAIEVSELLLKKWPTHRDAPAIQDDIARTYEELAQLSPEGPLRDQNAARALEARTKLAAYVGNTPWVDANRDDPEAIQNAERLVRGGLRRAAADHTNLARAYASKAAESSDANDRRSWFERSLAEYRLADIGWTGYLRQDDTAADAYESRFWIADARHGIIIVDTALQQSPAPQEVTNARQAAAEVRDSNEDDKYLQPSAYYVVDIAEQVLQDQYRQWKQTGGAQGIEERAEVKFTQGADGSQSVVVDAIPSAVQQAMRARDEYVQRVPASSDTTKNSSVYQFQVADYYFLYGHFPEAKQRFETIWSEHCGKDEYGFKAWQKLTTIAARSGDIDGSAKLALQEEKHSCAITEEDKVARKNFIEPVKIGVAYIEAARAFKEAEGMKTDGAERKAKWREAAAKYNVALTQPGGASRDEAPEAAINGAYAYKQVGEYDKAIRMYELFINNYGDEKTLAKLQEEKSPKYAERVKYLKETYDTLSKSYVLFFNYRAAAETYDKISSIERFDEKERREAAKSALTLYASMGDQQKMSTVRSRLLGLRPSAQEKAEADFIVADSDMKAWDPNGADDGVNRSARIRATNVMTQFYDANKNANAAAKYVVQAAYDVARMRRAAEMNPDEWRQKTLIAFERYKGSAPLKDGRNEAFGSPEAGMAAECEYAMTDEELKKKFDYDSGHHRYAGTSVDVIKKYRSEAEDAKRYQAKLQHVIDAYQSPDWATAAIARQGSLFDSLRTGLYNTRAPQLKLIDDKTEKILKRFEQSDNPDDQDKVDQIRQKYTEAWRTARERELDSADSAMVHYYGLSVALAKRYNVRNAAVNRANSRLAFFTDILGEQKLRQYTQGIEGLEYREGLFLQTRPGLTASPTPQPLPPPAIGAQ